MWAFYLIYSWIINFDSCNKLLIVQDFLAAFAETLNFLYFLVAKLLCDFFVRYGTNFMGLQYEMVPF